MSPSTKLDLGESTPSTTGARLVRSRSGRVIAGALVAGLTVAGFAVASGTDASAAAPLKAQAVGRLVDGSLGGSPIQAVADVDDARATAPGNQSVQNPLNVTLLNTLDVPLTGVINLSTSPTIVAGAVNQVAAANLDGSSVGAAGAVSNQGGIEAGGTNSTAPALGTIDISGSSVPSLPLAGSLPGAGDLASLGGITGSVGAVSAEATTETGGTVTPAPKYNIASLTLDLSSPALGQVLSTLGDLLNPAGLPGLGGILPIDLLPQACTFTTAVLTQISFAGGGITIDPTTGTITVDLAKLLVSLHLNINKLPANTDLLAYLLNYITNPTGLAAGLTSVLTSITDPGRARLTDCVTAIAAGNDATQAAGAALTTLLNTGAAAITTAVNTLTTDLATAAPANPLAPIASGLAAVLDIGINVESGPGIQAVQTNPAYEFTTSLSATPNQNTPVVANQTLIRALEINLLKGATLPVDNLTADAVAAGGVTVALANAAVGPSAATIAPSTTPAGPTSAANPGTAVNTNIPTGVPAGFAKPAGSPELPLILLAVALLMAGGGAVAWKVRGRHS